MPGILRRILGNIIDLAALALAVAVALVIAAGVAILTYQGTSSEVWSGLAVAITIVVAFAVIEEIL